MVISLRRSKQEKIEARKKLVEGDVRIVIYWDTFMGKWGKKKWLVKGKVGVTFHAKEQKDFYVQDCVMWRSLDRARLDSCQVLIKAN